MDRNNWSDFEKAWQSIDELKEKLERTELQLQNASRNIDFSSAVPNAKKLQAAKDSAEGDDNYLKERRWRKRKIYSRLKGSHIFREQFFDDSSTYSLYRDISENNSKLALHIEDPNPSPHASIQKLPQSTKPVSRNNLPKFSDALPNGIWKADVLDNPQMTRFGVSEIIKSPSKLVDQLSSVDGSRIRFSRWEKEYLNKEVPDIEVPESCLNSVNSSSDVFLTKMVETSVLRTRNKQPMGKLSNVFETDGLKKLQKIVNLQKERNNRIIAGQEFDPLLEDGVSLSGKLPLDDNAEADVTMIDASIDTRQAAVHKDSTVDLVRKVAVAPKPKAYKGFSHVKGLPTVKEFLLKTRDQSPSKFNLSEVPKSSKRLISPLNQRESGRYSGIKHLPPPCVILNDNPKSPTSAANLTSIIEPEPIVEDQEETLDNAQNETIDLTDSPPKVKDQNTPAEEAIVIPEEKEQEEIALAAEITVDDKENCPGSDAHLIAVNEILEQLAAEESVVAPFWEKEVSNPRPALQPHHALSHNKKRKATKTPDVVSPTPKIRHYNRAKILEYIERQKALRKKKLIEERQKKVQAEEKRKAELHQVFEYQKHAMKCAVKIKAPKPGENENAVVARSNNVWHPSSVTHGATKVTFSNKPRSPKKKWNSKATIVEKGTVILSKNNINELNNKISPNEIQHLSEENIFSTSTKVQTKLCASSNLIDRAISMKNSESTECHESNQHQSKSPCPAFVLIDPCNSNASEQSNKFHQASGSDSQKAMPSNESTSHSKVSVSDQKKSSKHRKSIENALPKALVKVLNNMIASSNGSVLDITENSECFHPNKDNVTKDYDVPSVDLVSDGDQENLNQDKVSSKVSTLVSQGAENATDSTSVLQNVASRCVEQLKNHLRDIFSSGDTLEARSKRINIAPEVDVVDKSSRPQMEQASQNSNIAWSSQIQMPNGQSQVLNDEDDEDALIEEPMESVSSISAKDKNKPGGETGTTQWAFKLQPDHDRYNFINTFQRKPLVFDMETLATGTSREKQIQFPYFDKVPVSKSHQQDPEPYSSNFSDTSPESQSTDSVKLITTVSKAATTASSHVATNSEIAIEDEISEVVHSERGSSGASNPASLIEEVIAGSSSSSISKSPAVDFSQSLTTNKNELSHPKGNQKKKLSVEMEEFITARNSSESASSQDSKEVCTAANTSEDVEEYDLNSVSEPFLTHSTQHSEYVKSQVSSDLNAQLVTESLSKKHPASSKSQTKTSSQLVSNESLKLNKIQGQSIGSTKLQASKTLESTAKTDDKSKPVCKDQPLVPLLDSSVKNVVIEAASAAATSTVMADLEQQNIIPGKGHLKTVLSCKVASSENEYSPDFESSNGTRSTSAQSHSSIGVQIDAEQSSQHSIKTSSSSIKEVVSTVSSPNTVPESLDTAVEVTDQLKTADCIQSDISSDKDELVEEPMFPIKKGKQAENVSSPSPASLSENESIQSTDSMNTSESALSNFSQQSGDVAFPNDSVAQLTLDMVKRMTYEEQMRARHQMSVLKFQDKYVVRKAQTEMKLLELLKELQGKTAVDELPLIKKRQRNLILRLRQERAQLHCMQETYRGISQRGQALLVEKKKLLTEPSSSAFHLLSKEPNIHSVSKVTEKYFDSVHSELAMGSSEHPIMDADNSELISEVPDIAMNSSSSGESVVESQSLTLSKAAHSSYGKHKSSSTTVPGELGPSQVPQHSSHSLESVLNGMKRLEANKRYLGKKEQRLLQRKNHVESLLKWQKKLDQEEKIVNQLELKAVENIETSKMKSKYYISTSSSSPKNESQPHSEVPGSSTIEEPGTQQDRQSSGKTVATEESSSVPSSATSVETAAVSSDQQSSDINIASEKTSSIVEEQVSDHNSSQSNIEAEDEPTTNVLNSTTKDISNSSIDTYSDSFVPASVTPNGSNSPAENSNHGMKKKLLSTHSSLGRYRRQDSSGSDDSFTISHSETASDQSDIEGRVYALAEELKCRKAVADKLRREQKKQHWEHLREKEISLRKQLEAYDKYIMETSRELQKQLDAVSSPESTSLVSVKPQIKQPRVAKSRHLQKQSVDVEPKNKDNGTSTASSEVEEVLLFPKERKSQPSSHLAKKLRAIETKEVHEDSFSATIEKSTKTLTSEKSSKAKSQVLKEIASAESKNHSSSDYSVSSAFDAVPSEATVCSMEDKSAKSPQASIQETIHETSDVSQNNDSTIDELIETPMYANDSSSSSVTLQKSDQMYEDDSFESASVTEEHEDQGSKTCNSSNGCLTPPPKCPLESMTFSFDDIEMGRIERDRVIVQMPEIQKFSSSEKALADFEPSQNPLVCDDTSHFQTDVTDEFRLPESIIGKVFPKTESMAKSRHQESLTSVNEKVATSVSESMTEDIYEEAVDTMLKTYQEQDIPGNSNAEKAKSQKSSEELDASSFTMTGFAATASNNQFDFESDDFFTTPTVDYFVGSCDIPSLSFPSPPKAAKPKDAEHLWFFNEPIPSKSKTQLPPLDQQLLVKQYPYYYRQIPNKPPPPYTPPASPLVHTPPTVQQKAVPKAPEKPNVLQEVLRQLDGSVNQYLEVLFEKAAEGLQLKDVEAPQEITPVENPSVELKSQMIYRDFLFDLTKETILKLYVEKPEDQPKHKPWLRNQRLIRKPLLPPNKYVVTNAVLSEMRKSLKLDIGASKNKHSIWTTMKLGRKKRDFVDTIIISELKEEEPDWINYDEDEFEVKLQLTDSIFNMLFEDSFSAMREVLQKKEKT